MERLRPDTQSEKASIYSPLNQVGMEGIFIPLTLLIEGKEMTLMTEISVKVSLDNPEARGIHMSRLYLLVQELSQKKSNLENFVNKDFLMKLKESQKMLSQNVYVTMKLQLPLLQTSLKSNLKSWRALPVEMEFSLLQDQLLSKARVVLTYSSTCPASAALARQLISENFQKSFSATTLPKTEIENWLQEPTSILATPHAQRSTAEIELNFGASTEFSLLKIVAEIEDSLQTTVQGAVKREDEQEFALRNGQNLMFCEDVARRVQKVLESHTELIDYNGKFTHFESLHAHNAVSRIQKKA